MKKVTLISLGCPKNLIDSEYMLGALLKEGFSITSFPEDSNIVIVNTCAFIESAQQEAIDTILEIAEQKGKKKLCVAGCLVSLFKEDLLKNISQIDAIIDPFNIDSIVSVCRNLSKNKTKIVRIGTKPNPGAQLTERCITGPIHSAYLKIADGCDNCCSYCIIPNLRGGYYSRRKEDILEEAEILAEAGCKEINIIAQDTTLYGKDIYGETKLAELLESLCQIEKIQWLRLLYTHPAHYSDSLIKTIANNKKICRYLDIPLQHCNDKILKKMGRKVTKKSIIKLINKIREEIPDVALRTTFLVGFPIEGDTEFNELLNFTKEMQFEHLGVFSYSPQPDTCSFKLNGQVSEEIKQKRREKLLSLQKNIIKRKNKKLKGKEIAVLVDKKIDTNLYEARREIDAPEIDNVVYITGKAKIGNFYKVKINKTGIYEFEGEIVK